jgi:hypothetical protein
MEEAMEKKYIVRLTDEERNILRACPKKADFYPALFFKNSAR